MTISLASIDHELSETPRPAPLPDCALQKGLRTVNEPNRFTAECKALLSSLVAALDDVVKVPSKELVPRRFDYERNCRRKTINTRFPGISIKENAASVRQLLEEAPHSLVYLAANTSECGESFRFAALHGRGVFEAPVNSLRPSRKHRTVVPRVVANRDHVIEWLAGEFIDRLRAVARNVDSDFLHNRDGFGPHQARLRAGALDLITAAALVPKQAFAHLAARRVASA
jgi:hypothetical protein